ncbi:class I SAM-dependent methyltransferase [Aliiroseovarius sp.]|uniref:class I SAM-dependent methyltransferase n=1 Tax=Aliiroseovarius sp. TaxID=1872442 RepID=UPI003BA990D7
MSDDRTRAMLDTNADQAAYYDATDGGTVAAINGRMTNLWRVLRHRLISAVPHEVREGLYDIHKDWIGDPAGKKVLELGCGSGSALSEHLADHAGEYHAIDLSEDQIRQLRERLGAREGLHLHVADVLSDEFAETEFDLIYAQSIFHHFRFIEVLFDRVETLLAPGGRVITLDPVQAWWPARIVRGVFRPFQTDADWEFPFTARTLRQIETRFRVEASRGLFNRSKWALVLGLVAPERATRLGTAWFRQDLSHDPTWRDRRASLQISYMLSLAREGDGDQTQAQKSKE